MSDAPPNSGRPAWARHLRPTLADVSVYDMPPADPQSARLHANECPEPWPDEVMDALAEVIRTLELSRYPDTSGRRLRAVLGERHGCDPNRVVLGNGSDEIIALLLTALSSPSPSPSTGTGGSSTGVVVLPVPTFVMYGHVATVLGMEVRTVPLTEQLSLDRDAFDRALDGATICFLARPNNPTGSLWSASVIEQLIADHPAVVFVIDEAYVAYAPEGSSMARPDAPDNQVHMGTLSKVGLAALRVGYCVAHPALAEAMNKVRHPYNVSQTSLTLAEAVLQRFGHIQAEMIARTRDNRARLARILDAIPGATALPSAGNLVVVRLRADGEAPRLRAHLAERGVLVKDVSKLPRLERCLRVSVGTEHELDRLERALDSWS